MKTITISTSGTSGRGPSVPMAGFTGKYGVGRRALLALGLLGVSAVSAALDGRVDLDSLNGDNGFTIVGPTPGDWLGRASSGGQDLNGDNRPDMLIGAPKTLLPGNLDDAGAAYLIYGRDPNSPFGRTVPISGLTRNTGMIMPGHQAGGETGRHLDIIGDIDNDGRVDFSVSASRADSGGVQRAGEVYVVYGVPGGYPDRLDLTRLNGQDGFVIEGHLRGALLGNRVAYLGDINDDGVDDFAVTTRRNHGRVDINRVSGNAIVYVIYGRRGRTFSPRFTLANRDPGDGFAMVGRFPDGHFGNVVAGIGDVNGDGVEDLIVGAPQEDEPGAKAVPNRDDRGRAYVVFGRANPVFPPIFDTSTLNGRNGFVLYGRPFDESVLLPGDDCSSPAWQGSCGGVLGESVSAAGDVNADGVADFLVSAKDAWPGGRAEAGEAFLIFGRRTAGGNATFPPGIELAELRFGEGLVMNGIDTYGNLGHDMAAVGDISGDGVDDMLFGVHDAFPASLTTGLRPERARGEAYAVFGDKARWESLLEGKANAAGEPLAPVLEMSDLDGTNDLGFVARGQIDGASVGDSVAAAGDIDGDGVGDVIIGATFGSGGDTDRPGQAYVLYGRKPPRFCSSPPQSKTRALTWREYRYAVDLSCNQSTTGLQLRFENKPAWLKLKKTGAAAYVVNGTPLPDVGDATEQVVLRLTDGTHTAYQQYQLRVWRDTDGDGIRDRDDDFRDDPNKTKDSDGDGVSDNNDVDPNNAKEWGDRDRDGVGDNSDVLPGGKLDRVGLYLPGLRRFYLQQAKGKPWQPVPRFGPQSTGLEPVAGDWDGAGGDAVGLYDPRKRKFVLYRERGMTPAHLSFSVKVPRKGLAPAVGDWDGYRRLDGGLRPPTVTVGWYDAVKGKYAKTNRRKPKVIGGGFRFGPQKSKGLHVVGDWDGDGVQTVGVYFRGKRVFWLANRNVVRGGGKRVVKTPWAKAGWLPYVGDWDGDGKDELGLFDPKGCVFHPARRNGKKFAGKVVRYRGPSIDCASALPVAGAWLPVKVPEPEQTTKTSQVGGDWTFTGGPDVDPAENNPRYTLIAEKTGDVTVSLAAGASTGTGQQAEPVLVVLDDRGAPFARAVKRAPRKSTRSSRKSQKSGKSRKLVAHRTFPVEKGRVYTVVAATTQPYLPDVPYLLAASQATADEGPPGLERVAGYDRGPIPPDLTLSVSGEWRCTGGEEIFANPGYLVSMARPGDLQIELRIDRSRSKNDLGTVKPVLFYRVAGAGGYQRVASQGDDSALVVISPAAAQTYEIVAGTDRAGFTRVLHSIVAKGPIEDFKAAPGNGNKRGVCDRNRR